MSGFVVWMTGLSGTGKSTLASLLTTELTARGVHVECLDGDEVRKNLSHGLGFAREDRDRNVRRIGYVARMIARSGACSITAAISPYRALRAEIRSKTENFIEVYCECPIEVLTTRDPKGLYKRALAGEIKNFTGVDDPYEAPENPEVHLRTDLSSPEECLTKIVSALDERGLLVPQHGAGSTLPPPFGGEVFEARPLTTEDMDTAPRRIEISADLAAEVRFVGAGFLSPVSGFMTVREAHKVQKGAALERGTPWWSEPFVLEIAPNETIHEQEPLLLTHAGQDIAQITCEDVWAEGEKSYVAGPINAVHAVEPSARELRRTLQDQAPGPVSCLFLTGEPDHEKIARLELASKLTPNLTVALEERVASLWDKPLSDLQEQLLRFTVPSRVPITETRAQAVIARSIGALNFAQI